MTNGIRMGHNRLAIPLIVKSKSLELGDHHGAMTAPAKPDTSMPSPVNVATLTDVRIRSTAGHGSHVLPSGTRPELPETARL